MSGGKGSNTTSTTSAPPPEVMAQWNKLMERGSAIANRPYTPYGGPQVAAFTPSQGQAFRTIDASQGMSLPYIGEGANYFRQGAAPISNDPFSAGEMGQYFAPWRENVMANVPQFSREAINQYLDPYLEDVVGAEESRMVEDERRQRQDLIGNAISSGAWGGDRAGIAQAELMRQHKLARDPALARLRSEGYGQAVGQFARDQGLAADLLSKGYGISAGLYGDDRGRELQAQEASRRLAQSAGAGIAGLGSQAMTDTLRGAEAQLGIGGMQQEQAQRYLNVPYQQFQEQQQYPWQSTQFLSNLLSSLSGAAGGTSSTTAPGPNPISQIAGLGLAAGGLGWTPFGSKGGRVHRRGFRRAYGGRVWEGGFIPADGWSPVRSSLPPPPEAYREEEMGMEDMMALSGMARGKGIDATPATPKITARGQLPWLRRRPAMQPGIYPMANGGPVFDMEEEGGAYSLPENIPDTSTFVNFPPVWAADPPGGSALPPAPSSAPSRAARPSPEQSQGLMAMLSKGGADPRMAMIMAGLQMAAGESPNAITNIAQGGIGGMKYLAMSREEAAKREQESAEKAARDRQLDLMADRLAEDAKYRSGMLDLGREELGYKKDLLAAQARAAAEKDKVKTGANTMKGFLERVGMDYPGIIDPATGYWNEEMDPAAARKMEKAYLKHLRDSGDFESAYAAALDEVTGGRGFTHEDNWFTANRWAVTPEIGGAGEEEGTAPPESSSKSASSGETVRVRFQGRIAEIPADRLDEALQGGAEWME